MLLEQEKAKLTNTSDLPFLKSTLGDQESTQAPLFLDEGSKDVDGIVGILFSLLFFT